MTKLFTLFGLNETEIKELLARYRKLLRVCKPFTDSKDKQTIRKAFNLAAEAHKGMRRRSGEPYIFHPLEVAIIAAGEIGLGTTSIICALLHDVVEDTDYTLDDISGLFGEKVAKITDGLTKISGFIDQSSDDTPSMQAENFRKILLTLADDVRVILIKLADRLHNMRTLDSMPAEKRVKIASETSYLFAPLAHRLGLYAIKSELEDLVMKYTEPGVYNSISRKLEESEEERKKFVSQFIKPIDHRLKSTGLNYQIIGRTKSINSIWNKMVRKQVPFEEVYDIFAIRIILDSDIEQERIDCLKTYSIVTEIYKMNPDRLRDWISVPKANGYEALHTTVMSNSGKWVEVQIRSKRMDEIAEKGYAAHWRYKENNQKAETALDDWMAKVRELLQRPESNALDFLDDIKLTLFSDEIFVFTPKGEMKNLPKGSSVLDFAYIIHTNIGTHCIGAKVNHKLVSIDHILRSGDQVEVIFSENQFPKEEWLNYVITARARQNIKMSVKEQNKGLIERGREIVLRTFAQIRTEASEDIISEYADSLGFQSLNEFYIAANKGACNVRSLKSFVNSRDRKGLIGYLRNPFKTRVQLGTSDQEKQNGKVQKPLLNIEKKVEYLLAECCNPIMGDEVIGFVLAEDKIEVHRANCSVAKELSAKYGDRLKKVRWTSAGDLGFKTGIRLNGTDKKGIVRDISRLISEELSLNIRSFKLETTGSTFEGEIILYVDDTEHLNDLMKKLKAIEGIRKVVRMQ